MVGVSTRGLGRTLQRLRPRAVLVVGYGTHFHRVAFFQSWRAGHPILFRGETTDHSRQRTAGKAWVRDRALGWLYRRCATLLYVGQRSYQHFRRLSCPNEKLIFSPYCIDSDTFACDEQARCHLRHTTRERLGIPESDRVLLFSGKLIPRKGPELLLRAVKDLPGSIRERVVTMFLGSGELRQSLQCLAQSPPSVRAHFLGFQNQISLSSFYHAADLLVLPSLHSETWGLVVNEALHHGVPCVVSAAVGCAPDLIDSGVTGEVFETGSVQGLTSSLRRSLLLTDRYDIRLKCRQKVSGYNLHQAAQGVAQAYARVVE